MNNIPDQGQKKICFAVLVHNKKDVVNDLLDNIKFFCPNSSVVLYNGGDDPSLCNDLGVLICPTSRKLQYGVTAIYLLETMKWLEDLNLKYDYLINLDSDALFIRDGYEKFITDQMVNKDYMGVETKPLEPNNYCGIQLKKEFSIWEPLFRTRHLYESFNVGQVFSRRLVKSFLTSEHFDLLLDNLNKTKAFGVDEIAYVTMTDLLGFELNAYPTETGNSIRYRPYFPLDETVHLLHSNKNCFLLHPVRRDINDETRAFINRALKQKIQFHIEKRRRFLKHNLGDLPFLLYRKRNELILKEWLTVSGKTGITYWRDTQSCQGSLPSKASNIKVDSFTAIVSKYGKIEAICRVGHKLYHYSFDEKNDKWYKSKSFAFGVTGTPMFIENSYGNYEVVSPLKSGGLGHWVKNNKHPKRPWVGPVKFGKGAFSKGILIENNDNQLTVVAEVKDGYCYFVQDDGKSYRWLGPFI